MTRKYESAWVHVWVSLFSTRNGNYHLKEYVVWGLSDKLGHLGYTGRFRDTYRDISGFPKSPSTQFRLGSLVTTIVVQVWGKYLIILYWHPQGFTEQDIGATLGDRS